MFIQAVKATGSENAVIYLTLSISRISVEGLEKL